MPLTEVAREVLEERYLLQDDSGRVVETPDEMFRRVAANLAEAEERLGGDPERYEEEFYQLISSLDFLPNSPTLMNAGTELQQLEACFVLPVEDSLESIFDQVKHTALIHQSGGGTGFSFSRLRPKGDVVRSTGGVASGPVSFMKVFDGATEQIKQGGRRRGANMGVLRVDHPDVGEFVEAKREEGELRNFNVSVATTGEFWEAYESGEDFPLINPRTGEEWGREDPEELLDLMAESAWESGDPGVLFLDTINRQNPTPVLGEIEATNPCGEQPLLPYEACVLGSVNLSQMVDGRGVDWDRLEDAVRLAVRFLDNSVEMSEFPLDEISEMVEGNRKVGLGVMGFHDLLIQLGIPYYSEEALDFAGRLMAFIQSNADDASRKLAEERGVFPNWEDSVYDYPRRNATVTTVAPTGTISLIAGCSSGIEPIYSVRYVKQVLGGLEVTNEHFVELAEERGFYSEELMDRLMEETAVGGVEGIPEDVKRLFATAQEIPPEHHVEVQAAFQRHVENAVSKTVNVPREATVEEVKEVFLKARELGCKGVTVFRSGSRREQVLGESPLKEECIRECDYVAERDRSEGRD